MTIQSAKGVAMTARNVEKILSGDKHQTRRIIAKMVEFAQCERTDGGYFRFSSNGLGVKICDIFPPHEVGDFLYVREALENCENSAVYKSDKKRVSPPMPWEKEDGTEYARDVLPARFMPKKAARTFLKVVSVDVQRVQHISFSDVLAEGCAPVYTARKGAVDLTVSEEKTIFGFCELWEETNGSGSWARNDWVWVYGFEVCRDV